MNPPEVLPNHLCLQERLSLCYTQFCPHYSTILNKLLFVCADSLSCILAIKDSTFYSKLRCPVILRIREQQYTCYLKDLDVALAWIPRLSEMYSVW